MGRESGRGNAEDAADADGRSGGDGWSAYSLQSENKRATAWLSQGIETLMQDKAAAPDFDFVIVGSGYGGAVAISEIAGSVWEDGRPVTVCMLERGNEYLPGAFPSRFADLTGHIRFSTDETSKARGRRDGLFDVRIGPDVSAVVANGLGGGSLINAGVMEMPVDPVFAESAWPKPIREDKTLRDRATGLMINLGAVAAPTEHEKFSAMRRLGHHLKFGPTQITVANRTGPNAQHVHQEKCIACGDCATGCNHQAKTSLDVTLLVTACRAGAKIYTGATVLKLAKRDSLWVLDIVHTTAHMRRRQLEPFQLCAKNVILCAGTFGSTEILLRSSTKDLCFSSRLGRQFSANGDSLAVAYNMTGGVNAVADEGTPYKDRNVGPTITCMVDLRTGRPARDMVIQDLGIPGPLRRAFEETFTTANAIHELEHEDPTWYRKDCSPDDPNAVDPRVIRRCLPVAIIGRDSAEGTLLLVHAKPEPHPSPPEGDCEDLEGDGAVTVHWPGLQDDPLPVERHERLDALLQRHDVQGLGGRLLANPMWRLLPPKVASVLGEVRGANLTVHPLGGCPMGDDVQRGVVDHAGRVFNGNVGRSGDVVDPSGDATDDKNRPFHDGLYVLDGAIVPTSLGINPSLTIATLAHRAVSELRGTDWRLRRTEESTRVPESVVADTIYRPIFRTPRPAVRPADTMLEFTEQMRGCLRLQGHGVDQFRVEITLWFEAIAASTLAGPNATRALKVDSHRSELCIYDGPEWQVLPTSEDPPLLKARLSGTLNVFRHEPSFACERTLRGGAAWFVNRGLRDTVQFLFERLAGHQDPGSGTAGVMDRLRMVPKLASRAGDRRLLEYELVVDDVVDADPAWRRDAWLHKPIRAYKRLTYECAANPWLQLMRTRLTAFPCWSPSDPVNDTLEVHLPYFGWIGVPLVHFVEQEDQPTALADLTSVWMYIVRTLLHLHTWSLRKPDAPANRTPQRLPGVIRGVLPEIVELAVDEPLEDGTPVLARLTRYNGDPGAKKPPVLMIHGYSASGTTFAHPSIPCSGLAGFLCAERQRDVWVLDLRSSAGMPTAAHAWAFEDMGYADIPIAVNHVIQATGHRKIDIVAHCMGVAMLSMGLFGKPRHVRPEDAKRLEFVETLRLKLSDQINRLVMSQVAPVGLTMSPSNLLRAYLLRYLKNYLRIEAYEFRPQTPVSKADELLDRLLATVPYATPGEFRRENPLWPPGVRTPWVGVRHRMDALYGVTFKLANLSTDVRDHIDDFFGPLSFQTVSQVIHFAEYMVITDKTGECCFVDRSKIKDRITFPVFHFHGKENGLVDFGTYSRVKSAFQDVKDFQHKPYNFRGHQDCMIGFAAKEIFVDIDKFLEGRKVGVPD